MQVRLWTDDALEELHRKRYTCAIDVAHDHPDGLTDVATAQILGVSKQAVDAETASALESLRVACEAAGISLEDVLDA